MSEPKTVREWFEKLPDGVRESALEQMVNGDLECSSIDNAICRGLPLWTKTKEGEHYWFDLCMKYKPEPITHKVVHSSGAEIGSTKFAEPSSSLADTPFSEMTLRQYYVGQLLSSGQYNGNNYYASISRAISLADETIKQLEQTEQ